MKLISPIILSGVMAWSAFAADTRTIMSTNAIVDATSVAVERQVTQAAHGHILTNTGVWSPDGQWIVYDVRSDAAGDIFDGTRIEMVHAQTGEVRKLYEARNGARCGVVTFNPVKEQVAFILGPENPTPEWTYGASRRQGVLVDVATPGKAVNLDARDLTAPFTAGALRGGSHVHIFDGAGEWASFTYEDQVLAAFTEEIEGREINLRNVGVSVPIHAVQVKPDHPRNHDGEFFTVLATQTKVNPQPGSDEIKRAFEDAWVGTNGYVRADGSRQNHALAFQGHVITAKGETISEVFIVDLPEDVTIAGDRPLEGTATTRPASPKGTVQRRLSFTVDRKYPGIQGPRHWLRSSPDGSQIAFLMKDDADVVQLWTISPNGGMLKQVTHNAYPIGSAFTWSWDGQRIAHTVDGSVCVTDMQSGITTRLTKRTEGEAVLRPEACVFSPDGGSVAFVRRVKQREGIFNQVFTVRLIR